MDDDLALRPQSIPDPPRRTWPPEWALPLLGNTSLRQSRTPDPSPSLQGICEAEPGTSFCLHSSTSRPQLLASSATVPPEPAVYPSLPNTRPQSLNSVNSTCGRRTYDPEWKPSRSRSWSPCSRLGQSLHSRTACQKPNAGWCNSCGQQISSRTRTGASSPFRERYSTQEHTPTSTNLPTNQVVVSAVTTEVEAEDVEISAGVDHDQGHCRMAENRDFSHGSGLAGERLSDSLTEQSATLSSIEQETVGRAPQFYHGAYPGAPCPRGYRADNDTTDVRFPYSSSPEEERQTAHDLKSKETKPECYRSSLPIREPRYPPREPPPRRLVQLPRPEEWVLPPTSTQRFSDIPWIPVRRKLLPVPCSTVRLIRKPVGIYESHEGSTQAHQDDYGMSSDNIRRRLVADCCEPATVRRNSGTGMRAVPEATAKRQHGEIYYHSNPKDIVSGNDPRHDGQPHIGQGSSRQNEEHPQSDQPVIADGQEGACASEGGCACCRTDYSSDEGHRPCPSHASRSIQGPRCSPQLVCDRIPFAPGSNRPQPFLGADSELEWQPLIDSRPRYYRDDRRIGLRLGHDHVERYDGTRFLVKTSDHAYNREGADSSPPSTTHTPKSRAPACPEQHHIGEVGQHSHRVSAQQARRQIRSTDDGNTSYQRSNKGHQGNHHRAAHTRRPEFGSRSPQSHEGPQQLVSEPIDLHYDQQGTGPARHRSLCELTEYAASPVQLPMVRRRDRSSERATAELDRDHQLCQPAVSSSAEGSAAHRAPGRDCDRDCSHMADSTLVPDFDADGSCATNDNTESPSVISGSIEPSFSTARAAQESEVGPRRMEGLWRQQAAPSIPDNVLQLMCASVAPETLARYQQIIVSLTNYCGGIHCLDAASVSGFLEFTTRSTERPEATLRLARAAISFLADLQGRPAPDAAVVRRVHTALVATRTTKPRQATPVADVSMLVTYLKDLGSTEELPINELRQKAITLLSITAFCRPSDLACVARPSVLPDTARGTTNLSVCSRFRMDSIKWLDEGAELVFFGSKADKGMSGNTVLIERASDPDICPITTLKAYINATATARLSVDDQPVFISLKKPYKGLSSSAIAQILSQVLKDSGQQQGVTARSIRPTGARKAIEQGVEATVVQRRGRWKSSDVFHRHYAGVTGPATDAVLNN